MVKRILFLFLVFTISSTFGQATKLWEKSAANNNLPAWFDNANLTRGFDYGQIDGNDRLFVVSRSGGNFIYVLDAATGDSLGVLDATGISGGTYHISDVAVSDDGYIFLCNLSINGNLKVYKWENVDSASVVVIDEALTGRFGDKFSASGSVVDNSLVLWFASANSNNLVKFSTLDNAVSFTSETIDIGLTGGSASVGSLSDGSFYYNATGQNPKKFSVNGAQIGSVSGGVVSTGTNAISYITNNYGNEYFVTFQYGAGNENAKIVKAIGGDITDASTFAVTSSMQVNANANGAGDVTVKDNGDGTFDVFVLSTNNGLQAYSFQPDPMDNPESWLLTNGNIPSYFGANTERGMAYSNGKVYVVSRNGAEHHVFVHNAANGEILDTLAAPSIRTGYFPINCAEGTDDGELLICNMTLNANEAAPFMVYKWNATTTEWDTLVSYAGGGRMGDMFSSYGKLSDNSIAIYAGAGNTSKIVKFTTADNGATFTAEEITLSDMVLGSASNVAQANDGTIYVKSYGKPLVHFSIDGSVIDTVSTSVVATGASKVAYTNSINGELLLAYLPDVPGSGNLEKIAVVDLSTESPSLIGYTPSLGMVANANGTGSVDYYIAPDGMLIFFVMGSNNGLGSFFEGDIIPYNPMDEFVKWSLTNENIPSYFGSNTERGMAYSNGKVYVVSRNGAEHHVFVHNAANGEIVDTLAAPSVRTGYFPINCAEGTDDGELLICNMTLNANEAAPFMVYKWNATTTEWDTLVSYAGGGRMGDMFSSYGKLSDNSIAIYASAGNTSKIVKFTTTDNGVTFTAEEITLVDVVLGSASNVAQANDGSIYVKSYGNPLFHFNSDGSIIDTVSTSVVATGASKVVYTNSINGELLLAYLPDVGGSGNLEKVAFIDLSASKPSLIGYSPSLGMVANGNGTGSVDYYIAPDGMLIFFVMGSNNGLGSFFEGDIIPYNPMDEFVKWSLTNENIPSYFGSNTERGMAYSNGKVYVVSRNGAEHHVFVHNAANGEIVDTLAAPSVRTGYFPINCAEGTDDGELLICNMTLNANEAAPFMVYKWNATTTEWDTLVSYAGGGRMGDMFSSYGKLSDNSIAIYASAGNTSKIVKFTTTDNGVTFTAEEITLVDVVLGSASNVAQVNDGSIYVKSYGNPLFHFNSDGSIIDTVSTSVVATGATKIVYTSSVDGDALLAYLPDVGGSGNLEKVAVVDLSTESPSLIGYTPSLGMVANGNGTGSVDYYLDANDNPVIFVMGSNNGIASFVAEDITLPLVTLSELNESFEGDWLPEGWATFSANVVAGNPTEPWAQSSYKPFDGNKHAYMANYNTKSECALVTPPFNLKAGLKALHFFVQDDWNDAANDYGSVLKIMASTTSQTNYEDFVVIDSVKEADCYDKVLEKIVDLASIDADYAYIAFVVSNFGDPNDALAGGDNWILDHVFMDSIFTDVNENINLPKEYKLAQNYPNPFNPSTIINFSLKSDAKVSLKIFNILGQEVATLVNKDMTAGVQSINFNAHNLSTGMYIYRLQVTGTDGSKFVDVKKMMLLK